MIATIELTHPFIRRVGKNQQRAISYLFKGPSGKVWCYKLNTWTGRMEKLAELYAAGDEDLRNEYKGGALELFSEWLIKSMGMDKRVGIVNYQCVEEDDDIGVDGCGIGLNGEPATVQIKYRQANYVLSANNDHLSNFTSASFMKYGVDPTSTNMLIITTAKEVHWFTDQRMFQKQVRVLNREKLRVLIDDSKVFWKGFFDAWQSSLN